MQNTDRTIVETANIIPFSPRKSPKKDVPEKDVKVTTIAAVIAVTILHNDDENPEEKLLALIESSGEAEILDALDATDDLEADSYHQISLTLTPANEN